MTKICKDCDIEKDISLFYKNCGNKDGHLNSCKECVKIDKIEYNIKNKGKIAAYKLRYRADNIEIIRQYEAKYRGENKEKLARSNAEYQLNNREKINARKAKRLANDPNARIAKECRDRLHSALKFGYKVAPTLELVGCSSWEELRLYIEAQFYGDMSWGNYNHSTWHVHHIKPVASFDLTDPDQQRECFNYKNLKPLSVKDHKKVHGPC
jgi:hypothetical protein